MTIWLPLHRKSRPFWFPLLQIAFFAPADPTELAEVFAQKESNSQAVLTDALPTLLFPMKLALFVSGTGSNARTIIDRFQAHPEDGVEVVLLISNKPTAGALTMAAERNVPTLVLNRNEFRESDALLTGLARFQVDFIALAGFLWLVPAYLVKAFPDRILNIHPALLPDYGGKGMYGANVHRAVKAAGETESGITIHYVNEHYDEGNTVFQAAVRLDKEDSPEKIAERVLRLEHANYWRVIRRLALLAYQ